MRRGDDSPLSRAHRFRILSSVRPARARTPALLYGSRGLAHPRLGLTGVQRMGPVNHALAQRHICGVVEVHAPFADDIARGERLPGEKKKRR